ncbi:MAG: hypothetical protein P1V51_01535 [Deltaproteobacteria bacterium]|nr:hypothetical protein [Deltaproteobacteria bacterium]
MTFLLRLGLLTLLLGAAGCISPPTFQDQPVDCSSDADCAWMEGGATCASLGFCVPSSPVEEDGGGGGDGGRDGGADADGGSDRDGGRSDGGAPDGGGEDAGWTCPDPCVPPTVEILEPAQDAAVSSPLVLFVKIVEGSLPIQEVSCNLPTYTAWALALPDSGGYACTLPLDEVAIGAGFSVAVNAVDVMGHPGTTIAWYTRKD